MGLWCLDRRVRVRRRRGRPCRGRGHAENRACSREAQLRRARVCAARPSAASSFSEAASRGGRRRFSCRKIRLLALSNRDVDWQTVCSLLARSTASKPERDGATRPANRQTRAHLRAAPRRPSVSAGCSGRCVGPGCSPRVARRGEPWRALARPSRKRTRARSLGPRPLRARARARRRRRSGPRVRSRRRRTTLRRPRRSSGWSRWARSSSRWSPTT